jgi:NAD(P)-dependent dehydrogenase (short-subunit alcohol dehydrogenase family)
VVGCRLDVRDGAGFERLVETAVGEAGKLDFLFNNAGVGMAGDAHELGRVHFNRTIDINIQGVTNGIVPAYPPMVRQRSGHIVNTASLAGLVPRPLFVPYVMSKHAVVGLPRSLRAEAARYGVGVSAIRPSAIETPLLDAAPPEGLPVPPWLPDPRRILSKAVTAPFSADRLAEAVRRGIEKNRELIIAPLNGAPHRAGVPLVTRTGGIESSGRP